MVKAERARLPKITYCAQRECRRDSAGAPPGLEPRELREERIELLLLELQDSLSPRQAILSPLEIGFRRGHGRLDPRSRRGCRGERLGGRPDLGLRGVRAVRASSTFFCVLDPACAQQAYICSGHGPNLFR